MRASSLRRLRDGVVVTATIMAFVGAQTSAAFADSNFGPHANDRATKTPIKHVIIILGENRTFDHVFATYSPKNPAETVSNLRSKQIVNADGSPGPNYAAATQRSGADYDEWRMSPPGQPYSVLPPAMVGGPSTPYGCQAIGVTSGASCDSPAHEAAFAKFEIGLPDSYLKYALTGGIGSIPYPGPDPRIHYAGHGPTTLPPGPFQITSATHPYDVYDASPVHRLFQMWQQLDCSTAKATSANPSGCMADLFPWVEVTNGAGSNGKAQPDNFTNQSTKEGSTSMGFYNVQSGDARYFNALAQLFTMSDNYHQAVNGGTGANHVMIGTGDAIWFSDGNGNARVPPHNPVDPDKPGTPVPGFNSALSEVENPNPQPGTNNFYTQDGYGGGSGSPTATAPNANYGGGSYVDCADNTQPGVAAVLDYLVRLRTPIHGNCQQGHYYLVNNYNPGYFGDGTVAYNNSNPENYVYTIPPSNLRTIGDELIDSSVSWAYFGDLWNKYLSDKYQVGAGYPYCNICNWAQYSTSIMTDAAKRREHLRDLSDLYASINNGTLPAVSYVKPSGLLDGHPASSKLDLYEGFVAKIVNQLHANSTLWNDTAVFVTFDEGGGYWDSGYVQPLDFFGDGTRVPMIVVSRYTIGGHVNHTYTDHVSTLKFIEANWLLTPITGRSRDNLPNPVTGSDPYVPLNSPAIGDMMDMFHF